MTFMTALEKIYIYVVKYEGKPVPGNNGNRFIEDIYDDVGIKICCDVNDLSKKFQKKNFNEAVKGDLVFYCNSDKSLCIPGIVLGVIEKQLCYVEPAASIVRVVDYDEKLMNLNFLCGFDIGIMRLDVN